MKVNKDQNQNQVTQRKGAKKRKGRRVFIFCGAWMKQSVIKETLIAKLFIFLEHILLTELQMDNKKT